jgi:small subunit ribosomal protein S14
MAKKSMIAREKRRTHLAGKYAVRRKELRQRVVDESLSMEERWEAMMELQKLPRDSSSARGRNRCSMSGRPRGYFRKFGLSRNMLRDVCMKGEAPGVVKASW